MQQLKEYLHKSFGLSAQADLLSKKRRNALPLYIQGNFELYDGYLLETAVIWAKPSENNDLNPSQLKKQSLVLKDSLNRPIIFVFDRLDAWQRKRLIDQRIAFVHPPRQLYIPELFLELNDTISKKSGPIVPGEHLKPLSQLVLLYHIQISPLANIPLGEIARLLHLSTMSITRISKDLQSFQLVEVIGTKEKFLSFLYGGRTLWDKALPYLRSPVREAGFISKEPPPDVSRLGGEATLSRYTLLAENGQPSYCIGKEAFLRLRKTSKLPPPADKYGECKIEVWNYDPTLLSQQKEADKLSLYLTLAQEKDERVKGALTDLINEMQW